MARPARGTIYTGVRLPALLRLRLDKAVTRRRAVDPDATLTGLVTELLERGLRQDEAASHG
jgi:hypothetical protein